MNLSTLVSSDQSDTARPSTASQVHPVSESRARPQIFCDTPLASSSNPSPKAPDMTYSRAPQLPLSPPVEDQARCSLPSISSLLEGADRNSSSSDNKRQRPNPPSDINVHGEKRMRSHSYASSTANGARNILPPTPPLRPDSGFHSTGHSPTGSSASSSSFHFSNGPGSSSRNSSVSTHAQTLHRKPSQLSLSPQSARPSFSQTTPQSPFPGSLYPSPTIVSQKPLNEQQPLPPTLYYQQPPQSAALPPNLVPVTITPGTHNQMISPGNPAWQHHHYFPPSNTAPYPQNHDRYICRTCHKAFSRPSSLRIHSHSHTGEKPFRCPHVGCGKAFSVRSNMKRHERGCHTGRAVAPVLA